VFAPIVMYFTVLQNMMMSCCNKNS